MTPDTSKPLTIAAEWENYFKRVLAARKFTEHEKRYLQMTFSAGVLSTIIMLMQAGDQGDGAVSNLILKLKDEALETGKRCCKELALANKLNENLNN